MRLFLRAFFFFNDTATTEIYTLSLHDALPILRPRALGCLVDACERPRGARRTQDRKSTRLNSSHGYSSYAVFCLKKKTPTSAGRPPSHHPATPSHHSTKPSHH